VDHRICPHRLFPDLARSAAFKNNDPRWSIADAYFSLAFWLVIYGGAIPWVIYLAFTHWIPHAWLLLICVPFYAYLIWWFVKLFRIRLAAARKDG